MDKIFDEAVVASAPYIPYATLDAAKTRLHTATPCSLLPLYTVKAV